ncbi:hypothetical protein J4207_01935 [Candidatus Woesearchaeota archaeon]|nr:hypothetical protein [Candidatus Woesearchaeota archaeon]
MITYNDQQNLFHIISTNLKKNIRCFAFGGTAMIFYGYKDETKDVDFLFEHEEERAEFTRVLEKLGFRESSPFKVYIPEKLRDPHRPKMYSSETARFDLFVKKIFHTLLSPRMSEDVYAIHEFKDVHTLKVHVLRKEHLVILKSVTERERDFEDIRTIVEKEKNFDWQYLVDEVLWQYQNGDTWVLLDTIKMLHELRKYVFVEQKYLKQLTDKLSTKPKAATRKNR